MGEYEYEVEYYLRYECQLNLNRPVSRMSSDSGSNPKTSRLLAAQLGSELLYVCMCIYFFLNI